MFLLWRRFIVWLRTLLLKLIREEKIDWEKEFVTITNILRELLKKQLDNQTPSKPMEPEKPRIPNYDIIGNIKRPRKRLLDWLRKLW
jgi:hypothetical protein